MAPKRGMLSVSTVALSSSWVTFVVAALRARPGRLPCSIERACLKHLLDSAIATHFFFLQFLVSLFKQLPLDVLPLKNLFGRDARTLRDVLSHSMAGKKGSGCLHGSLATYRWR